MIHSHSVRWQLHKKKELGAMFHSHGQVYMVLLLSLYQSINVFGWYSQVSSRRVLLCRHWQIMCSCHYCITFFHNRSAYRGALPTLWLLYTGSLHCYSSNYHIRTALNCTSRSPPAPFPRPLPPLASFPRPLPPPVFNCLQYANTVIATTLPHT